MPYMVFESPCKLCGQENQLYRIKKSKNTLGYTREYICKICERARIKKHQQENREYWRELNKRSYVNWTEEVRLKRSLKNSLRHKRLRYPFGDSELTEFVFEEAHILRRLRDSLFPFKWHVDHIIPLNGKTVSGLHTWNNFQVIPAQQNLSKRNLYAVSN